ncbi:EamA family transporter RarD [Mycolicibacterium neworleansense]|uniref:EamA family transporter RarD n=1 Tax=Mycolicibacterium neworleansense TaxID=146018 RepID=UPI0013317048|nr:EamA family transporter RarD [Mycolicibacterium neworleansense]MCV7362115.1 EamA family transporter RarD [Mycolicibacterium neworleansense]
MTHDSGDLPARGVGYSLLASGLFGVVFYLSGVVDASPEAVFGWRMLIMTACYFLVLISPAGRRSLAELWRTLTRAWWMPMIFAVTSFLVSAQMWLFSWAPVHGHALDASLGYLLLPIVLVLVGRIGFKESVSALQWVAAAVALAAVVLKVVATSAVSWVTFVVCIGYALYFGVRRRVGLDSPTAFGVEVALTVPVAVLLIVVCRGASSWSGYAAVVAVGLAGTVAMAAYVAASSLLSMPVFGLLTYVEPVLLFGVALMLGERLTGLDAVVYALLAVALTVLAIGGFRTTGRKPAEPLDGNDGNEEGCRLLGVASSQLPWSRTTGVVRETTSCLPDATAGTTKTSRERYLGAQE